MSAGRFILEVMEVGSYPNSTMDVGFGQSYVALHSCLQIIGSSHAHLIVKMSLQVSVMKAFLCLVLPVIHLDYQLIVMDSLHVPLFLSLEIVTNASPF